MTDSPVKRPMVDKSQVRPSPNIIAFPTPKEGEDAFVPSVDDVLRLLWAMAQDPQISSGPRVQAAATLLKDLRGTPAETEVAPEEVVASMKAALGVG